MRTFTLLLMIANAWAQLQQRGTLSPSQDYEVSFVYNGGTGMVQFTVRATVRPGHWAAIGFSEDMRMENTDAVIAFFGPGASSATIWDTWIVAKSQAGVIPDATPSVNLVSSNQADGTLTFTFSRMLDTKDSQDLSLSECRYMLFAWNGPVVGGRIFKHASQSVSSQKVCIGSLPQIPTQPPLTAAPSPVVITSPPVTTAASRAVNCGRPPNVEFATSSFANQEAFGVGSIVFYSCLSGYVLVGQRSTTCLVGGIWQRPQPPTRCLPIISPQTPAPVTPTQAPVTSTQAPVTAAPTPATVRPATAVTVGPVTAGERGLPAVNPCAGSPCPTHSTCKIADGGFGYCDCNTGYRLNLGVCVAIATDPCVGKVCPDDSTCLNGVCQCDAGYAIANGKCDRVLIGPDPCLGVICHTNAGCVVREGIAYCVCNEGYRTVNIGECVVKGPCYGVNCGFRGTCVVKGGRGICECVAGYRRQGGQCVALDLCSTVVCGSNSYCEKGICLCESGYMMGTDKICRAMKTPCESVNCPENSACSSETGIPACICISGYTLNADLKCVPADPCAGVSCLPFSTCKGGVCECNDGYTRSSPKAPCLVANPCRGVDCPKHSSCKVTIGIASCLCDEGYIFDSKFLCVARNPCSNVLCGPNAACKDGKCECRDGYSKKSGSDQCTAIDPCDRVRCGQFALCRAGVCVCIPGYFRRSANRRCVAIDPCAGVSCPPFSTCKGGKCECNDGYRRSSPSAPCVAVGPCTGVLCPRFSSCLRGVCVCESGYSRPAPNRPCQRDLCASITCGRFASCVAGTCRCNAGYSGNPILGCTVANPCSRITCGTNALCTAGVCRCISGFVPQGTNCVRDLCFGISCPLNSRCDGGICRCLPGFSLGRDSRCYAAPVNVGQSCRNVCGRYYIGGCSCQASCVQLRTCCTDYNFYCGVLRQPVFTGSQPGIATLEGNAPVILG